VAEDELIKQIEAMRDDPDAWGEPVKRKPKSERRQRGAMVSVRFTPEELATVQAHADQVGASVSGYIRNLALNAARQPVVTAVWASAAVNCSGTSERLVTREALGSYSWLDLPAQC
jgi:hypothetical protein